MRTLLVDDDLELLNSLTQYLIGIGLKMEAAQNINRARSVFQQDPKTFGLVITEIELSTGNGFSLLKWMRRKNPWIQAIIITREAELDSALTAIKCGVTDYLEKPLNLKHLQSAVMKCRKLSDGVPPGVAHSSDSSSYKYTANSWRPQWHHDLVQLMRAAVQYWMQSTGTNKGELARRSGLWKTQVDRNTVRARTLDRYLIVEKLPQNPQWQKILETARYVLKHCPPSSQRFEIEMLLYRLHRMLSAEEEQFPPTPPTPDIPPEPGEFVAPPSGPSRSIPHQR